MNTKVLERPDTDVEQENSTDEPKYFHYVKKDKIAESAVMGNYVVALCGATFPVTQSPKPGSPICPKCKDIYAKLQQ